MEFLNAGQLLGTRHARNKPGIYVLWFAGWEQYYVGSSKRVLKRLSEWAHSARIGLGNVEMQGVLNSRGAAALQYGVLEYCPEGQLAVRERYWESLLPTFNVIKPHRDGVARQAEKMRELGVRSRIAAGKNPDRALAQKDYAKEWYKNRPLPTKYKTKRWREAKKMGGC